jgi:hypothetical protein
MGKNADKRRDAKAKRQKQRQSARSDRKTTRNDRKENRANKRTERANTRVSGRNFRIGEGGGSNFADSVGAVGGAFGDIASGVAEVGGLFVPGLPGSDLPFDASAEQGGQFGDAAFADDEPTPIEKYGLPAAGAAVLAGGLFILTRGK